MLLLALDTATLRASVALVDGEGRTLAERERQVPAGGGPGHGEGLLGLVDETLRCGGAAPPDLAAVVCGRGPGSFTGLRIGLATAKGLCLAAGKPLVCLPSLAALGAAAGPLVCAVLDARRGEVFGALVRGGALLGPEVLCRPAELAAALAPPLDEPLLLAGDGALLYRELLLPALGPRAALAPDDRHVIHARHLGALAAERVRRGDFDDLAAAVPRYVRPSDARLPERPLR